MDRLKSTSMLFIAQSLIMMTIMNMYQPNCEPLSPQSSLPGERRVLEPSPIIINYFIIITIDEKILINAAISQINCKDT